MRLRRGSLCQRNCGNNKMVPKNSNPVPAAPAPHQKTAGRTGKRRASGQKVRDQARVVEIFRRFQAANPHPKSELEHSNRFTLLVAVVLSAQATDAGVNKATRALFSVADDPAKMVQLGETGLRNMISAIGLYRAKAKNIVALSEKLLSDFGGEVPNCREALESLPGVGRKTANVVMNAAFGAPVIAVDTHVFRVSNRIPLAVGRTVLDVENGLTSIIPGEFKHHAHHWLILHGRYICKARAPLCNRCLINDLCQWPEKRV
jgi:endonuclease III